MGLLIIYILLILLGAAALFLVLAYILKRKRSSFSIGNNLFNESNGVPKVNGTSKPRTFFDGSND